MEPTYIYKKGEGWIPVTKREFPHNAYDTICNCCGKRAGKHKAYVYMCPDPDDESGFSQTNGWT